MIKKLENCLYCGEKMQSQTAKKRFCSTKCRVYFNRDLKNINKVEVFDTIKKIVKSVEKNIPARNMTYLETRRKIKNK